MIGLEGRRSSKRREDPETRLFLEPSHREGGSDVLLSLAPPHAGASKPSVRSPGSSGSRAAGFRDVRLKANSESWWVAHSPSCSSHTGSLGPTKTHIGRAAGSLYVGWGQIAQQCLSGACWEALHPRPAACSRLSTPEPPSPIPSGTEPHVMRVPGERVCGWW